MKEIITLYLTFCKVGAFTFGGGYAMLPIIYKEVCDRKKWCTRDEVLEYYAASQCLPGIIAVNTAIFVGYKKRKVVGGISTALGAVTPSLIIIVFIATFLQNILEYEYVIYAFNGIRIGVCAIIFNTFLEMAKKNIISRLSLILFGIVVLLALLCKISSLILIIFVTIFGFIALKLTRKVRK